VSNEETGLFPKFKNRVGGIMRKGFLLLWILVCVYAASAQSVTEGSLFANDAKGVELGPCPLKTTSVKTDISGFVARVTVRQEFENKFATPIEAVYAFPLSQGEQ
jgi:Ca-activated chloride channel family protein